MRVKSKLLHFTKGLLTKTPQRNAVYGLGYCVGVKYNMFFFPWQHYFVNTAQTLYRRIEQ